MPADFDSRLFGLRVTKSVGTWQELGVAPDSGEGWPDPALEGSIVRLRHGPVYLAFNNFRVIMGYNDSAHYATAVGHLADGI